MHFIRLSPTSNALHRLGRVGGGGAAATEPLITVESQVSRMSNNIRIGDASGTYNITAGDDGVTTIGNGNDTIVVSGGDGELIRIGNGEDTLTATGGAGNNISIGNGNDSVT
jgi:hypothetical protein